MNLTHVKIRVEHEHLLNPAKAHDDVKSSNKFELLFILDADNEYQRCTYADNFEEMLVIAKQLDFQVHVYSIQTY